MRADRTQRDAGVDGAAPEAAPAGASATAHADSNAARERAIGGDGPLPALVAAQLAAVGTNTALAQLLTRPATTTSPAEELIDRYTDWGSLAEDRLGAELLQRALRGEHRIVESVLDALGTTDRDDVSFALIRAASDGDLLALSRSGGQELLSRMFDELTSGRLADDEKQQADRVMTVTALRNDPDDALAQMEQGPVFPFKLPGLTVLHDAPIIAERRPGGRVWVQIPPRVFAAAPFRADVQGLPTEVFVQGILLPEEQLVGVRLYDVDEKVVYQPALFLVQLSNEGSTATADKLAEIAGLGVSFGVGAVAETGAAATWGARAVVWTDRAATSLGTIAMVLDEHRGMLVAEFGEPAEKFLRYVDIVDRVTMIYGYTRVAVDLYRVITQLRKAYGELRAAVDAADAPLSTEDTAAVQRIGDETERLLDTADEIAGAHAAGPPGAAASPAGTAASPATPAAPAAAASTVDSGAALWQPMPGPPRAVNTPDDPTLADRVAKLKPGEDYDYTVTDDMRDPVAHRDIVERRALALEVMSDDGLNQPVKVVALTAEPRTETGGDITTAKFVLGRTPEELAAILGVADFVKGVRIYRLDRSKITLENLNLRGLTQSPAGKHPARSKAENLEKWPVGQGVPQWNLSERIPVESGVDVPPGTPARF
ncbi:hypothetical protein Val02_08750 [Virgisporangium aliadipatigenens]|uniref:Uncharacterized protein n=1 Tax=Virgisporangium aliadipatigenens TaxID=741659 RepID=A0A8J4DN35_9ACTN|nr:hypothetical protein [Virgisporangium aliadipatigenens]GIJ43989.1 hypothetical protein Val02_08750 [Virgisporangium aliadipatigenens]